MNSSYGQTSGSDSRESRSMMESLMVFSLAEELERLRSEAQWTDGDRNSRTLAKDIDFRVMLTVLREGARLDEQQGDARASIHVLRGNATVHVGGGVAGIGNREAGLAEGQVATIDAGRPWELVAASDCAVLLTLAWPNAKAGV